MSPTRRRSATFTPLALSGRVGYEHAVALHVGQAAASSAAVGGPDRRPANLQPVQNVTDVLRCPLEIGHFDRLPVETNRPERSALGRHGTASADVHVAMSLDGRADRAVLSRVTCASVCVDEIGLACRVETMNWAVVSLNGRPFGL
jgi:hypothetical protein